MDWDWSIEFDSLIERKTEEWCVLEVEDINVDVYQIQFKPLAFAVSFRIEDESGKNLIDRLVLPGGSLTIDKNNRRYMENVAKQAPPKYEPNMRGTPRMKQKIEPTEWEALFSARGRLRLLVSASEPGTKVAGTLSGKTAENILII
jgi:hypothetical protein